MRLFEIDKQVIEVYDYNEAKFQEFLKRFHFDFVARPYRPLKWYEKLLRIKYKPAVE